MITVEHAKNFKNIKAKDDIVINIDHIVTFFTDNEYPTHTIIVVTKNEVFDDIHCFNSIDNIKALIKKARKERS